MDIEKDLSLDERSAIDYVAELRKGWAGTVFPALYRDAERLKVVPESYDDALSVVHGSSLYGTGGILGVKGVLQQGELDAFHPPEEPQARLTADGQRLMERLLRTISETDDSRAPMREQFLAELGQAAG